MQDKIVNLGKHDISFLVKGFLVLMVLKICFLINLYLLCKDKKKSKAFHKSKIPPLHDAFLPRVKHFVPKIVIQFNKTPLVLELTNCKIQIVNA